MALLGAGREMWGEDCLLQKGVPRTYPTRRVQDGSERRTIEGDSPVARASAKGGAAWQGTHSPRVALLGSAA